MLGCGRCRRLSLSRTSPIVYLVLRNVFGFIVFSSCVFTNEWVCSYIRVTNTDTSNWDGNNEYEQQRATLLAELGYIALAADIFGADLQTDLDMAKRVELSTKYRTDTALFVQRMETALAQIPLVDGVDPENIAVIGYCFGT
jgi:Dienelactone hydrolase family